MSCQELRVTGRVYPMNDRTRAGREAQVSLCRIGALASLPPCARSSVAGDAVAPYDVGAREGSASDACAGKSKVPIMS